MATFLLTWELGGGLGHLVPLRAIGLGLAERGHRAVLAVNDLTLAAQLVPQLATLPVPLHVPVAGKAIAEPSTFAEVLHNAGCGDAGVLAGLVKGWRSIFEVVRPEAVVMDFSPIALAALQGWPARRVLLGFGYGCPPDVPELPDLCPWRDNYPERLRMTESQVLARLNDQLAAQGQPPLAHVAELFRRADLNILTTFRELDHYHERGEAEYWGVLSDLPGEVPEWPAGARPRVLAYLKPMPVVGQLLGELARRGLSTLAYVPQTQNAQPVAPQGSVWVTDRPLDFARLLPRCDLAILNAGHYATARALLAGKPLLLIPISGEQQIVATGAVRLGAAVNATDGTAHVPEALDRLLDDERYAQAARRFAARYADFDSRKLLERILDRLQRLVTGNRQEAGGERPEG